MLTFSLEILPNITTSYDFPKSMVPPQVRGLMRRGGEGEKRGMAAYAQKQLAPWNGKKQKRLIHEKLYPPTMRNRMTS